MKALIYGGARQISYGDIPDPILFDQKSAIIRTTLCALCGSDLHAYHKDTGRRGYCIGHEAVGEVVEVGREVNGFAVGDRVLLPGTVGCGECVQCFRGKAALCEAFPYARVYGQGTPELGGCQAEAVAVPAADKNLARLPTGLSDRIGLMLTDNLATAWFAARQGGIAPGDVVAVIGLGAVGLQCVMAATAMGASQVLAIDLLPDRRALAARLGAVDVEALDALNSVRDLTRGIGPDVIIDANGGPTTTALAINLVRRGGRVSVVGVSESSTIEFPIQVAMNRNLEFRIGSCNVQAQLPTLIRLLEQDKLSRSTIENLFTHEMPLSQGSKAYEIFDARADGILKVALDPTR